MAIHSEIKTLGDIANFHAERTPEAIALAFEDSQTTYAQLDQYANQVSNGLLGLGLKPQDRVAYFAKNTDSYFELLLGLSKFGAVMVGVNWRLAAPEVEYILNDAEASVLVIEEAFFPVLEDIITRLPKLTRIVTLDGKWPEGIAYKEWRDRQLTRAPELPIDVDSIAMQLYTSGTTGYPKGVLLSHRAVMSLRQAEHDAGEWSRWQPGEVSLVVMPVFHIGGASMGIQGLYNGAKTVVLAMADPGDIIHLIQKHQVTRTFVVPAVILFMVQHPDCKAEAFKSLRVLLYGASPIANDLLKTALELFKCGFVQIYGMTETAGSMTFLPFEDHSVEGSKRMESCGKPYPGVELAIIDPDAKRLAPHEVGEIIIKSPSLMDGYWHLPDATRDTIKEGWLHSGDAGYLDEDGYLYIFDRIKDMIVSGAENIYPAEIENVLFEHPGVKDVAVIGVPSEKWGEEVKALVIADESCKPSEQDIIDFAKLKIAGFKAPKSVDFVAELPRNPSGKLLKKDIRKPYWEAHERQVN